MSVGPALATSTRRAPATVRQLGVHPAEGPSYEGGARHQLSLMCDDIAGTVEELRGKGVEVRGEPRDEGYGITAMIVLPGDLEVELYEPRHRTAI